MIFFSILARSSNAIFSDNLPFIQKQIQKIYRTCKMKKMNIYWKKHLISQWNSQFEITVHSIKN